VEQNTHVGHEKPQAKRLRVRNEEVNVGAALNRLRTR